MDATFNQRRALHNMYTALKKPMSETAKIRTMSAVQASTAIRAAKREIEERGFPKEDEDNADL